VKVLTKDPIDLFDPSSGLHRKYPASIFIFILLAVILLHGAPTSIQASAGEGPPVSLRNDVVYETANGESLTLDAYMPGDSDIHPGIVLIHGGRWTHGDKTDLRPVALELAADGFAVFSVNYRLAPQFPYPAAAEDLASAVEWIRARSADFGVDPRRIGAFGGSAGGYLAAMLATSGEGSLRTGSRVAAAASWSGPLDLVPLLVDDNPGVAEAVRVLLGCVEVTECAEEARLASPISHVDPTDAPLFIANSTGEVIPASQAQAMAAAYEAHGLPHELRLLDSTSHGIDNIARLMAPTVSFFRRWLGGAQEAGSRQGEEAGGSQPTVSATPTTAGDTSVSEGTGHADVDGKRIQRGAPIPTPGLWLVVTLLGAIFIACCTEVWLVSSIARTRRGGS
jgi:acetyl esterase/lipase